VNKRSLPVKTKLPFIASVATGILLFVSFPPFNLFLAGWFALVPLMLACVGTAPRRAALLGWLAGAVFFSSTLFWIRHVTWLGTFALAFYCALYLIPFSVFIALRRDGWKTSNGLKNIAWMTGAAAVWTASEYLRAIAFTGFPWNPLGVSQYAQIPLIQIAEWGGVYAVSALMVFVNAATAVTLVPHITKRQRARRVHIEPAAALLLVAAVWFFGFHRLQHMPESEGSPLRAALVQPNIPEVGNWELANPELIYQRLETLTRLVQHSPNLDLIIWPETALPDFVRYSTRSSSLVKRLVSSGVPLLAGSMDVVWHKDSPPDYYNASMLFDRQGALLGTYYKQHLVLFGEYIPFDGKIPLVNALTPIGTSFKPGPSSVLFKLPGDPRGFCVLICFEDSLPYLARNAARNGAAWLVNQTNDSWFDPDSGSRQHLANAVFRCVETRLPMLRCTNTGVTCSIDAYGHIDKTLAPQSTGFQIAEIIPADPTRKPTLYVRFGDLFAQACLLGSLALFLLLFSKQRKHGHA
jgi:apolipoprotein N-acyltransferase